MSGRAATAAFATLLAWVSALAGCRCGPLTGCEMDAVDAVNRKGLALDHLYNPATDPTRVGRPDWCATVPDALCRKECCRVVGPEDVPAPQYRVYPQPETNIDVEGELEESVEAELKTVLPPLPAG